MRLANRINNFDSSDFQEVFRKQRVLKNPIDLSVGIPEDLTASHIKQAGVHAIQNDHTFYLPASGMPELRVALSQKLKIQNKIDAPPEAISIVPGLTTGLLLVYMALLDPGDEVIIMDPSYPPYEHLATLLGAEAMKVLTLPTFQLDIPTIEASITHRTKAIVINSPNNPTGAVYAKKDLLKLAEIADRNNLVIISDEIYESFIYEGEHFSIGSVYPNTITMGGFSKEYAMTGWRLGYLSGPQELIDAVNELQQYVVFSSNSIAQHAALEALKHPVPLRDKYSKKRNLVLEKLREYGYALHGGQGAYYVFIQAPHQLTDIEFVEKAAEHNLLILPGRAFSSRHGYVRLSYGNTISEVEKGLSVIKKLTEFPF